MPGVLEDRAHLAMRFVVELFVRHADGDLRDEALLHRLHREDERGERAARAAAGAARGVAHVRVMSEQ